VFMLTSAVSSLSSSPSFSSLSSPSHYCHRHCHYHYHRHQHHYHPMSKPRHPTQASCSNDTRMPQCCKECVPLTRVITIPQQHLFGCLSPLPTPLHTHTQTLTPDMYTQKYTHTRVSRYQTNTHRLSGCTCYQFSRRVRGLFMMLFLFVPTVCSEV
jgi:hypothetical protein